MRAYVYIHIYHAGDGYGYRRHGSFRLRAGNGHGRHALPFVLALTPGRLWSSWGNTAIVGCFQFFPCFMTFYDVISSCDVTWRDRMSCHVTRRDRTSCHGTWRDRTSCHVTRQDVMSCNSRCITLSFAPIDVTSHEMTPGHVSGTSPTVSSSAEGGLAEGAEPARGILEIHFSISWLRKSCIPRRFTWL